jgi:hypothetical protein
MKCLGNKRLTIEGIIERYKNKKLPFVENPGSKQLSLKEQLRKDFPPRNRNQV